MSSKAYNSAFHVAAFLPFVVIILYELSTFICDTLSL